MRNGLHTLALLLALGTGAPPVLAEADSLDAASGQDWALETPGLSDDGIFALPDPDLLADQPGDGDWLLMPPEDEDLGGGWLLPETGGALPTGEPLGGTGN